MSIHLIFIRRTTSEQAEVAHVKDAELGREEEYVEEDERQNKIELFMICVSCEELFITFFFRIASKGSAKTGPSSGLSR